MYLHQPYPKYSDEKNTCIRCICFLHFKLCRSKKDQVSPVIAPFSNLDTLAINDWWNRANNPMIGLKVERDSVIAFGIYTVSNNTVFGRPVSCGNYNRIQLLLNYFVHLPAVFANSNTTVLLRQKYLLPLNFVRFPKTPYLHPLERYVLRHRQRKQNL